MMTGNHINIRTFSLLIFLIFMISGVMFGQKGTPSISEIIINGDSVLNPLNNKHDSLIIYSGSLELKRKMADILFEVQPEQAYEYQFMLKGSESKWSRWQEAGIKEYTNLSAGHFVLYVRYRDANQDIIELPPVSFTVLPIWSLSSPALSIYFVLMILTIWFLYNQLNLRFARKQYMLEQIINSRTEELIKEKEKSETLLSNVLPKNTAAEIMAKGKATKTKYNFVTVLFSDIQGFTKIAEEMNPEVLIDELDKFFFHFDSVVEKYGIEKIKTIGDAYMCAGGIPEKNRTNPVEVILAALEMQQYMHRLKANSEIAGMKYWDIRIGIHTGTVIAGVVGQKKLSYDIWGDTVNTASRMESSGDAGKINISGTTYEFVKEFFVCEYRGKMPVKYKGELDMYFVEGIIDELKDESGNPNSRFITKMQLIKLQDVEEYVIKMFDEEAPPNLYFHNSALLKNIVNQTDLIANAEKLEREEYIDLRLAATFLLSGYINNYEKPCEGACQAAEEVLSKFAFTRKNIENIKQIITNHFAWKIESISDKILSDSSNDYLGRVDYVKLLEKLFKEETEYGHVQNPSAWIEARKKELSEHQFFTPSALLLRNVSPEEQLKNLETFSRELR
jgi:adenylate cyclase